MFFTYICRCYSPARCTTEGAHGKMGLKNKQVSLFITKIMKKYLFLLTGIMMMPFLMISCGDDKDSPKNIDPKLVGEWIEKSENKFDDPEINHINFEKEGVMQWWTTQKSNMGKKKNYIWHVTSNHKLIIQKSNTKSDTLDYRITKEANEKLYLFDHSSEEDDNNIIYVRARKNVDK